MALKKELQEKLDDEVQKLERKFAEMNKQDSKLQSTIQECQEKQDHRSNTPVSAARRARNLTELRSDASIDERIAQAVDVVAQLCSPCIEDRVAEARRNLADYSERYEEDPPKVPHSHSFEAVIRRRGILKEVRAAGKTSSIRREALRQLSKVKLENEQGRTRISTSGRHSPY
ncbi:hypothetical protein FOMA001_g14939 [Fusarium oxysporum f. sp. matthiolae]|nr:hypothetical protein FOMA001_g14939 [Fusarium oxysporum f. sp. matthiolae]